MRAITILPDRIDGLRSRPKEIFGRRKVEVACLFGSQATGRAHGGSDVDVAVLFDGP